MRAIAAAALVALGTSESALGHGGGAPVDPSELASQWSFPPLVALGAAAGLGLFLQAFVRLRRRGRRDHASWGRLALFVSGLAAWTVALASPLDPIGENYLLSGHMLQHVLVADVAPALIVTALRGPLLFFFVPPPVLRALARVRALRRVGLALTDMRLALVLWAVVIGGWHVPAAYGYAIEHVWAHNLEHATFVAVGFLVWTQIVNPARRPDLTRAPRLAAIGALFWMGTVLADVLIFSFRPLYPVYAAQPERLLGLSVVRDQQLAGIVMMVEQAAALGAAAIFLLVPELRRRRRTVVAVRQEPT